MDGEGCQVWSPGYSRRVCTVLERPYALGVPRAGTPAKVNGHVYKMVLGSRERSHEAHVVESSKSKSLRDAGNLIRG